MHVYILENKINKKKYIGASKKLPCQRRGQHFYSKGHKNPEIKKDLEQYGKNNFQYTVIKEFENIEDMYLYEKEMIERENTLYPNGYNLKTGGVKDVKYSEESKRRQSLAQMGEKNHLYGKKLTIEHREKIKKAHLGISPCKQAILNSANIRSKKIINVETNEIYQSQYNASIALKISPSALCRYLKGRLVNNKYPVRYYNGN